MHDFANHFITAGQFEVLLKAHYKVGAISQLLLDSASDLADSSDIKRVKKRLQLLIKQTDSLKINLAKAEYKNCKFEEIKDPNILCVSLRGIIYFEFDNKGYQWIINEALQIKGEWRISSIGTISEGTDANFLEDKPDNVSAFGTMSKVKVRVVLAPPPPDTLKPPPPPPPAPLRKKKNNDN